MRGSGRSRRSTRTNCSLSLSLFAVAVAVAVTDNATAPLALPGGQLMSGPLRGRAGGTHSRTVVEVDVVAFLLDNDEKVVSDLAGRPGTATPSVTSAACAPG